MPDIPVLVVDDQSDIRFLVRTLIDAENEGLRVAHEAENGRDAIDYLAGTAASAVVLDQMMPGMTGIEAAREILATRAVPIVLFSAYLDDALRAEARDIGIVACLDKRDFGALAKTVKAVAAA